MVVAVDARTNESEENGSDKQPSGSTSVPTEVVGIGLFDWALATAQPTIEIISSGKLTNTCCDMQ